MKQYFSNRASLGVEGEDGRKIFWRKTNGKNESTIKRLLLMMMRMLMTVMMAGRGGLCVLYVCEPGNDVRIRTVREKGGRS